MYYETQIDRERCVTCHYWQGDRKITTVNSKEKRIDVMSMQGVCPMIKRKVNFNQTPIKSSGCCYKRWYDLP